MRKRLIQYFFRLEYLLASLLVMVGVQLMLYVSDQLPEADETSFLNPILDRIDFLNIADVSLDAIFAVRDTEFPDTRIKIVNIGEVSPTPDGKIAALLYRLDDIGVRSIGIDIVFDEYHLERFPPERYAEVEALRLALLDVQNVVLGSGFDPRSDTATLKLLPPIRDAARHFGFVNLFPDPDGVIRRFRAHTTIGGERWLSLPVKMLEIAEPSAIRDILEQQAEQQVIYYSFTYELAPSIPIDDILYGTAYDSSLEDAIVLVGFVNEGELFYLGDTHKTPLGRKIGLEGPDMPGVLIHANIINMLLQGRYIVPVPPWVDWLLVFVLSYLSIALYRVLRTKPPGRFGVAVLITTMLFAEAVIVFFLPLIAFFYFNLKISYNLMATAVLLFIPANALTTWLRFQLRERRLRRQLAGCSNPLTRVFIGAFRDNEPFIAHTRLLHAGMSLPLFAHAVEVTAQRSGVQWGKGDLHPQAEELLAMLPPLRAAVDGDRGREYRHFLMFLAGKKEERLRESAVKEAYLSTELQDFNEFVVFDEWEVVLPYVRDLWLRHLRSYLDLRLASVSESGQVTMLQAGAIDQTEEGKNRELPAGVYRMDEKRETTPQRLSPHCVYAECKIHRRPELFVLAGFMRKQAGIPPIPAYFGEEPNCEPVLPRWIVEELQELTQQESNRERS